MSKLRIIAPALLVLVIGLFFHAPIIFFATQGTLRALVNTDARDISMCQSIGVGHRACGGVEKYVVYSVETTNVNILEPSVRALNYLSEMSDKYLGGASICTLEGPPEIELRQGNCVAK